MMKKIVQGSPIGPWRREMSQRTEKRELLEFRLLRTQASVVRGLRAEV